MKKTLKEDRAERLLNAADTDLLKACKAVADALYADVIMESAKVSLRERLERVIARAEGREE